MSPVPPPMSTMGLCPDRCQCMSSLIGMKLPMCRLSEVGSKPQYATRGGSARCRSSSSPAVRWCNSPRQASSSRKDIAAPAFATATGYHFEPG